MCLRPGGDACVLGGVERAGNALYLAWASEAHTATTGSFRNNSCSKIWPTKPNCTALEWELSVFEIGTGIRSAT